MKRLLLSFSLTGCLFLFAGFDLQRPAQAESSDDSPTPAPHSEGTEKEADAKTSPDSKKEGGKDAKGGDSKATPEKKDEIKETFGTAKIGAVDLQYKVRCGTMPVLKKDGTPRASVFFTYYAASNSGKRPTDSDAASRPLVFCFNGGPGSSSVWLHLGCLGPRKIDLPADGTSPVFSAKLVDNANSILDSADLVFIDPVNTGLSRASKGEKDEQFLGVDEDIESIGEFIRLFTTREKRWSSPKFLCGESYGGIRGAGLANYLQSEHGMYFNGLILLSAVLDFGTISPSDGNDLPYVLWLPTLTATAHYHKKLPTDLQSDLGRAMQESRDFAQGEYAQALLKGKMLSAAERAKIAEKLARFTGLAATDVEDQELRISSDYFRKRLLWAERKTLGRFDARVTREDEDRSDTHGGSDPSLTNVIGAFSAAVNAYVRGSLQFESDLPYRVLAPMPWRYSSYANRYVSMEPALSEAMISNPGLHVMVLSSLRDLAVPADTMRFSLDHLGIPSGLRGNIQYASFESGHMMYLNKPDADKLHGVLTQFIRDAK